MHIYNEAPNKTKEAGLGWKAKRAKEFQLVMYVHVFHRGGERNALQRSSVIDEEIIELRASERK